MDKSKAPSEGQARTMSAAFLTDPSWAKWESSEGIDLQPFIELDPKLRGKHYDNFLLDTARKYPRKYLCRQFNEIVISASPRMDSYDDALKAAKKMFCRLDPFLIAEGLIDGSGYDLGIKAVRDTQIFDGNFARVIESTSRQPEYLRLGWRRVTEFTEHYSADLGVMDHCFLMTPKNVPVEEDRSNLYVVNLYHDKGPCAEAFKYSEKAVLPIEKRPRCYVFPEPSPL